MRPSPRLASISPRSLVSLGSLGSLGCLALSLAACGGDGGGGATPDGGGPACQPAAAVAVAPTGTLLGVGFEGGAPRALIARDGASPDLVLVDAAGAARVLWTGAIAGAALDPAPDGALCAAWVGVDRSFHSACAPGWAVTTPSFAIEQSEGELAFAHPTRACGFGQCVDAPSAVVLYSDIAIGAVVDEGSGWVDQELYTSSISAFGEATVAGGLPWACFLGPTNELSVLGSNRFGELRGLATDTTIGAPYACRIATAGPRVYIAARGSAGGVLDWFDWSVGSTEDPRPTLQSVALPAAVVEARAQLAVVGRDGADPGVDVLFTTDAAVQQAHFSSASGAFGPVSPVAALAGVASPQKLAARRAGGATAIAVQAASGVYLAQTCE
ncbi:MAG: hypothetical protein K8W52_10355 [Deltaproteobacteria bacterium]|nr:hypothetical protein [Deltaproteobacteria bacterium]